MAKGSGSAGRGGGGGAAPAAGGNGGGVAGAALAEAALPEFAAAAVAAARSVPIDQRYGAQKVLIADAYAALARGGSTVSVDLFKDRLLAAHRRGDITLSRADAPLDGVTRQRSQIDYLNATYHLIRLDS
jgi:hypothetical protein